MLRLFLCCLVISFSYNIAWAKYCVKLPSCEELGYVFPYKEGRRQIRCPFDIDKVLYLDYCQAYGLQGKPDEVAGEYQECIEEKADGTKINTGYYRYTRCNVGYRYESGHCVRYSCNTPHTCLVGDVYLHDNEPIGVVFFDDGTVTKIVGLKNINSSGIEGNLVVYWTSSNTRDYYDIPNLTNYSLSTDAEKDTNGKSNTATILAYASANGKTVQAATATSLYAPNVCGSETMCAKGNWYLPAMGELWMMYNNLSTIDNVLNSVGGTKLKHSGANYFWSSTECHLQGAWVLDFYNSNRYAQDKFLYIFVRPVLAF